MITVILSLTKLCKNTCRYDTSAPMSPVRNIYVEKSDLRRLVGNTTGQGDTFPDKIKVQVTLP